MSKNSRIAALVCVMVLATSIMAGAASIEEQRNSIMDSLKSLDSRIAAAKSKKQTVQVRKLQRQKAAAVKRLNSLKEKKAVKTGEPMVEEGTKDEVTVEDVREDMNKAIADLKGQLDSVKKDNNDAKVSGEIRFGWTKALENVTNSPNAFDVSRAYVTIRKKLAGDAAARVTLDVSRISASSTFTGNPTTTKGTVSTSVSPQNLFDYIKYAYVDIPVSIPAPLQVIPFSLTAKLGLQHNMWIDWADKQWELAWMMKQFDDNEGIMSSADFGLGATGKFTLPYLNEIEYHAVLMNGGGYKVTESDTAKDIGLRLNTTLYKDDNIGTVTGGGYINSKAGILNTRSTNTKQAAVLVGIDNEHFGKAYAEYMKGTKVNGYSIGGYIFPAKDIAPLALVARYDNYDPDTTATSSNDRVKTLVGLLYEHSKDVKLAMDIQTSQSGSAAAQKTGYLHSVVYF